MSRDTIRARSETIQLVNGAGKEMGGRPARWGIIIVRQSYALSIFCSYRRGIREQWRSCSYKVVRSRTKG